MRRDAETIFLCGPMGCGKSTVGRKLAALLNRPFADIDDLVVARAGMAIHEMFERFGEPAFRAAESAAVAEACAIPRAVVALGGGTLLAPENRERIAAAGTTVYLRARIETLEHRVRDASVRRPLLVGASLHRIVEERRSLYEAADITVDVDDCTAEDVAAGIRDAL